RFDVTVRRDMRRVRRRRAGYSQTPGTLERRLDLEEALVVVERDRVGLLVQLDALGALDAHLPEQLLELDERARLVTEVHGRGRDAAVVPDADVVAHAAHVDPQRPRPAEVTLEHQHAVD